MFLGTGAGMFRFQKTLVSTEGFQPYRGLSGCVSPWRRRSYRRSRFDLLLLSSRFLRSAAAANFDWLWPLGISFGVFENLLWRHSSARDRFRVAWR